MRWTCVQRDRKIIFLGDEFSELPMNWPLGTHWLTDELSQSASAYKYAFEDNGKALWGCADRSVCLNSSGNVYFVCLRGGGGQFYCDVSSLWPRSHPSATVQGDFPFHCLPVSVCLSVCVSPSKPSARGNFSVSPTWSTRPTPGCGARSTSLWVHRNLFWKLARDRKLAWFEHVARHDSLSKTILQGTLLGGRRCGRQRKCWMDNIKELTSLPLSELLTGASCRKDWKRICAESSFMSPKWPNRSRDWTEPNCIKTTRTGFPTSHCLQWLEKT